MINIAIDGPSGAGKSTIARQLAKHYNIIYLDTGAMYRALALKALRNNINCLDEKVVQPLLDETNVEVKYIDTVQHIFLDGIDVSEEIRQHNVSKAASDISSLLVVREKMVLMQRKIAAVNDCVLDGRDICTKVLPYTKYKFFVTATVKQRAKRRYKELTEKGQDVEFKTVLNDIKQRDYNDMHRKNSPLVIAYGAKIVDTTRMTVEEAVEKITKEVTKRRKWYKVPPFYIFGKIVSFIFRLVFPTKIFGPRRFEQKKSIFVFNHVSALDPVIFSQNVTPNVHFMYKSEFDKSLFMKTCFRWLQYVPVKRGANDINATKQCIRYLTYDGIVGIFAEGTRNHTAAPLTPFKNGAAMLAIRTKAPVRCIYTFRGYKLFKRNCIVIGDEISLDKYYNSKPTQEVLNEISEFLYNETLKLREKAVEYMAKYMPKSKKKSGS